MLLSTPTSVYLWRHSFDEMLDIVSEAGFNALDFTFCGDNNAKYVAEELEGETGAKLFGEFKIKASEKGIVFNQAHAPFPSILLDDEFTKNRYKEIIRSLRNASLLGVKLIVLHPAQHLPYEEDGFKEKLFEINMEFFKSLKPYCEEFGIRIAIENQYKKCARQPNRLTHSSCGNPREMNRYLDELGTEHFAGCIDIGHAILVDESPSDFIREIGGDRLQALHVHDVDGFADLHTLPYIGMCKWSEVTKALHDIGYKGDFTFEANCFVSHMPKELVRDASKMMASVGKYLIEQIKQG